MIYVDSSVALAHLLVEDRRPLASLWRQPLIASRLLEYELWRQLHAHGLGASHEAAARQVLAKVSLIELSPLVLARALDPFPLPVRTLDALHLASLEFLRRRGLVAQLASYDERMVRTARVMQIDIAELN